VEIRKVIQRRIRRRAEGIDVAADVNAAIAANVGERRASTSVSSRQHATSTSAGAPAQKGGSDESGERRTD
jgi:hypothetical protein